jgi:hypothetical protein
LICNISHQDISRIKGFVWLQNTGNPTLRTTPFHCHFLEYGQSND